MRDIIGQESCEELVVCLPDAFTDRSVYIVGDSILERSHGSFIWIFTENYVVIHGMAQPLYLALISNLKIRVKPKLNLKS